MNPLVSIIIPTYNRSHLIGESLDSILAQTYTNWECIIIDDGSTDNTNAIVGNYLKKDARFQYYHRPEKIPKGANACRNYGFELCKGEFVNWFDSDDIMHKDFIKKKMDAIINKGIDFVVSYSLNFDEQGNKTPIFESDNIGKAITAENFISYVLNWITMDVMVSKDSLKGLRYNELLKSDQEYNFFSRYLFQNVKGAFVHECLSYRRVHKDSIQEKLRLDIKEKKKELFLNDLILLNDIKKLASKSTIEIIMKRAINNNYGFQKKFTISKTQIIVLKELIKIDSFKKAFNYAMWIISNLLLGKGYCFIRSYLS